MEVLQMKKNKNKSVKTFFYFFSIKKKEIK